MNTKLHNRLKRNIRLDYISSFIANLNMQSSIWVLYLAYCGLSLAEIGLLEGIYHATSMICEIPSGAVADLLGRKRSMVLSRICIALSCIIMLLAGSFWGFALSFIIQALGNNFNSGSEEALVYDSMKALGQEEQYMGVYGRLNEVIEVSQGIATVAGGILAEYSWGWCYGACVIIAVLALLSVVPMTEAPYASEEKRAGIRETVAAHFRACAVVLKSDRRIAGIIVYYSVVFAAEALLFFYSQQYYAQLGYSKIQISLILLIVSVISCAGAVFSEKIFRKLGNKTALAATLGIGAGLLCYGFQNMVFAVIGFSIAGFCNSVLYPVHSELLNRLIPSEQRATLISVDSMFFSIGMILMFPLAGVMADQWGLTRVFVGIGLVITGFAVFWNRKR